MMIYEKNLNINRWNNFKIGNDSNLIELNENFSNNLIDDENINKTDEYYNNTY